MMREEEMALVGRCHGVRHALGCFSWVIMCTVQNRQTTQHKESIKPLTAQSVRYDTVKHLILLPLKTVCIAFNLDTCFGTDRSIRPLEYNKTVKVKVH